MRQETVTVKIFQFDELDDKAKERAREWYRQGALDYEWWDFVYEDASNIDLKIEGFDLDHGGNIEGKILGADYVGAASKILKDHGPETDTYILAEQFLKDIKPVQDEIDSIESDDNATRDMLDRLSILSDKADTMRKAFEYVLLQEYLSMLNKKYEYLMSEEQVDESIRSNGYEFTQDGKWYC